MIRHYLFRMNFYNNWFQERNTVSAGTSYNFNFNALIAQSEQLFSIRGRGLFFYWHK